MYKLFKKSLPCLFGLGIGLYLLCNDAHAEKAEYKAANLWFGVCEIPSKLIHHTINECVNGDRDMNVPVLAAIKDSAEGFFYGGVDSIENVINGIRGEKTTLPQEYGIIRSRIKFGGNNYQSGFKREIDPYTGKAIAMAGIAISVFFLICLLDSCKDILRESRN
ncbi:MAG: hypothetical protein Q7J54_07005 [Candidatus Woesearchaeota archaeon]|nr:hypothetical protein [Candidatus Woesearchaeota archaeon]